MVAAFLPYLDPDASFLWAGYTGYDDNDEPQKTEKDG